MAISWPHQMPNRWRHLILDLNHQKCELDTLFLSTRSVSLVFHRSDKKLADAPPTEEMMQLGFEAHACPPVVGTPRGPAVCQFLLVNALCPDLCSSGTLAVTSLQWA